MELAIYLGIILFFLLKFFFIGWLILLGIRVLAAIFGPRDNSVNININITQPEKPEKPYMGPPQPYISPFAPPPEPRRPLRNPIVTQIGPPTIDHVPHREWLKLPRRSTR
jgi:hypothetical protein